jgi:hypothetical protein
LLTTTAGFEFAVGACDPARRKAEVACQLPDRAQLIAGP